MPEYDTPWYDYIWLNKQDSGYGLGSRYVKILNMAGFSI